MSQSSQSSTALIQRGQFSIRHLPQVVHTINGQSFEFKNLFGLFDTDRLLLTDANADDLHGILDDLVAHFDSEVSRDAI